MVPLTNYVYIIVERKEIGGMMIEFKFNNIVRTVSGS